MLHRINCLEYDINNSLVVTRTDVLFADWIESTKAYVQCYENVPVSCRRTPTLTSAPNDLLNGISTTELDTIVPSQYSWNIAEYDVKPQSTNYRSRLTFGSVEHFLFVVGCFEDLRRFSALYRDLEAGHFYLQLDRSETSTSLSRN